MTIISNYINFSLSLSGGAYGVPRPPIIMCSLPCSLLLAGSGRERTGYTLDTTATLFLLFSPTLALPPLTSLTTGCY